MKLPLSFRILRQTARLLGFLFPTLVGRWWSKRFTTPVRHPRPEWERKILESAKPLVLPGGLHAWKWGQEQDPLILLIHGWDGRGSQMGSFVAPLLRAGFRVIAIDGYAHGESPGRRTNLARSARALIEASQGFESIHGIVAHSFGAGVSVIAATWGLKVERLVLVSSPSTVQGVFDRFVEAMRIPERTARAFQSAVEADAGFPARFARVHELGSKLQHVRALLFHDSGDKEVPYSDAQELAAHWKQAELVTTTGLGHRKILRAEQITRRTAEFFKLS